MSHAELLGTTTLLGKDGNVGVPEDKFLLLYFSAHWCPPCRKFTPELAKYYKDVLKPRGDTEVVFVSSDRSEADFKEYYEGMPWLALPYDQRGLKTTLSKKFGVQGIPTLIVLDKKSQLITKNGREGVSEDPEGFPWKPLSLSEIFEFGESAKRKDGSAIKFEHLSTLKDGWALYFSAHWCPPCRGFTPKLVSIYEKMKAAGKEMEIVFVSWDREKSQFDEYYEEMPWATFPFEDPRIEKLVNLFEVESIPTLITFKGAEAVNKKARGAAQQDPTGDEFPWIPKPLPTCGPLLPQDEVMEAIQENPIILLSIFEDAADEDAKKAFCEAAKSYTTKNEGKGKVKFFFVEGKPSQLTEVEVMKCDDGHPLGKLERPEGWTCDRCAKKLSTTSSMGCKGCNYDVCEGCLSSRKGALPNSLKLFSKIASFLDLPEKELKPSVASVLGIEISSKTWEKHEGKLTPTDIVAFAEAFGAKC